ncbi:MAG: arsenate reductase ArsC [Firmicutes bacterium]|nr:arsenate reductase ArsC [Bacillota bacterium]
MKKILFICNENAGRSQMAEALANSYGRGFLHSHSGGSTPAARINHVVVQAMKEKGIDISQNEPKSFELFDLNEFDIIITLCAEGVCPVVIGKEERNWNIEDPKGREIEKVRLIRDGIEKKVLELVDEIKEKKKSQF